MYLSSSLECLNAHTFTYTCSLKYERVCLCQSLWCWFDLCRKKSKSSKEKLLQTKFFGQSKYLLVLVITFSAVRIFFLPMCNAPYEASSNTKIISLKAVAFSSVKFHSFERHCGFQIIAYAFCRYTNLQ